MLRSRSQFSPLRQFFRSFFIKTEPTPNPNSLIYRPENRQILGTITSKTPITYMNDM